MKAALLGDEDPDEWDLPPKPKGMRWATYERSVAKYDAAEEMLDAQLAMAAARLMRKFSSKRSSSRPGEELLRAMQAFVNVSGAASPCASTARLLFPLKPAVKGGLP